MKFFHAFSAILFLFSHYSSADVVFDKTRDRNILIDISYPTQKHQCTNSSKCPVSFISAGYGVSHSKYVFLTQLLNEFGYMTVSIAHELPQDPPLAIKGDLFESRSENWIRGANTLDFLQKQLAIQHSNYDFDSLVLVGHSNGGDISAWLANEGKSYVKTVITLDNRRVPLPRNDNIQVLSIRGSDFRADSGVLPTSHEEATLSMCIVKILNSRHNDMSDYGPDWLKAKITKIIAFFLSGSACASLKQEAIQTK